MINQIVNNVRRQERAALESELTDLHAKLTFESMQTFSLNMASMRKEIMCAESVLQGYVVLRGLSQTVYEVSDRKSIGQNGGIDVILTGMRIHKNNTNIQSVGCEVLHCMTNNVLANAELIVEKGGIDVVVAGMRAHLKNVDVQHHGCWVFRSLASIKHADNHSLIASRGAIDAIIKAMKAHVDNEDVQCKGCEALCNVAANRDNQILIGTKDGVEAIMAGMAAHPSAKMQYRGFQALGNLTSTNGASNNNMDNKSRIISRLGVVLDGMRAHVTNAEVQRYGCLLLYNLGKVTSEFRRTLREHGCKDVCLAAMKQFPGKDIYTKASDLLVILQ